MRRAILIAVASLIFARCSDTKQDHAPIVGLMMRVLVALLVLAAVGTASAADRIYLTCSGKGIFHGGLEFPESDARFIIDLDQGTVETTLGWSGLFASKPHIRPVDFSITSATETSIEFKGSHGDTPICPILGKIDRLSGSATVRQFMGETAELLRWYELDCKRTKPVP